MDKLTDNTQEIAEIKKMSETFASFIKELEILKNKKEVFGKSKPVKTAKPEKPGEVEPDEDDVTAKVNKMAENMDRFHQDMYHSLHTMANNLHSRIDKLSDQHWDHKSIGHMPVLTAGQMNKVLKTCGLEEDFVTSRKNVTCANKNVHLIEIDYKKPN